ncbi:hypothetical protein BsWGS_16475 [Bradybaena similaris]
MWLLVSILDSDVKYPILGDHKYVVGRQNCDIVIPDASVSRKQAVLTMAHYEPSVVKPYIMPILTLDDVSKFGTLVNGKAVKSPGGNTVTLKANDEIRFGGSPASIFKAVYEPFVVTTSCLEKAPKKLLIKIMCLLGGHLVRDWRPVCDLLIMSKINVTIKVICAINNQKHIVTPEYLDDLYSHLMGRREKPDPVSYLPEVVDQEVPSGVSFHPDIRRMTLLQGLKFYFLSAVQFNKTNLAVSTAGGQPILLEDGTEEEAEAMTEDKTVVVAVSREILPTLNQSCQKFVKLVISVLKRKGLRMVTDPEIGWAILTCNTTDFCNARSSITPDMLSYMAVQSMSQSTEVDTSHNGPQADAKPIFRSIAVVQSQNSLKEDIKPASGELKLEKLSLDQPAVKTEAKEEQLETNQSDATSGASQVSHRRLGLSNKSSALSAQIIGSASDSSAKGQPKEDSATVSSATRQLKGDSTSHLSAIRQPKEVSLSSSSAKRHSKEDTASGSSASKQHKEDSTAKLSAIRQSKEDRATASSAIRQSKEDCAAASSAIRQSKELLNSYPRSSQIRDLEADIADRKTAKRQKPTEDDNPEETVSVFARQKRKFQNKHQNNNLSDSDDDLAGRSKGQRLKQKPVNLFDDDDDDNVEAGLIKRRKTQHNESEQNRDFDSEAFVLTTKFSDNNQSGLCDNDLPDLDENEAVAVSADPGRDKDSSEMAEQGQAHIVHSNGGLRKDVPIFPAASKNGWLNTRMASSEDHQECEAPQNGDAGQDTKFDTELLRDTEGKPLQHLCQIEVVDLVVKRDAPNLKSAQSRPSGKGQNNFKKFRKTQHAGAGRLPTIIGGSDLEVYLGSKHKNIEDLFAAGLAEENERQEKELRDGDLFNWDERTRKTSNKRIR